MGDKANSQDQDRAVSFLLPEQVCEVQRQHSLGQPAPIGADIQKKKASRMLTATFCLIVVFIFGVICFSIWLSIEVGMKHRSIWSSGRTITVQ